MAKQSPKQKAIVERVMHEFKEGELEQRSGEPVKNPKQAIAIALHEAGSSNQESPAKNRANLRRTIGRERAGKTSKGGKSAAGGKTRADLYQEAKHRDIPGRSKMSKAQLERALG